MEPAAKLDPMTEAALRSLHDIAVPPPVSWMPQTWGWAMLAGLLALALLVWAFKTWLRYRRNAYRREALRMLGEIEQGLQTPGNQADALHALAEVLKRTALAAWPRADVAATSGADWKQFLRNTGGSSEALDSLLDDIEYRPDTTLASLSSEDLLIASRRWIDKHHVSA